MRLWGRVTISLALPVLALPAAAETVEILRDTYRTPHIFATTPEGVAFGAGYAQAEDYPEVLLRSLKTGTTDEVLSPQIRPILEAYAAGVNRVLPDAHITAAQVAAYGRQALGKLRGGSLMLDRTRSSSKSAIAILETRANWRGDDLPYEMSLYAGDLAIAGVAPLGLPFPVAGHSRTLALSWSGEASLEQALQAITARDVEGVRKALGGRIPRDLIAGDATGEVLSATTQRGYALQGERTEQSSAALHKQLAAQTTWPVGRLDDLAFSGEVYGSESWQSRLAKTDPGHPFTQMLTGWNRRTTVDSRPALAFYLFKMELGRDAAAIEPPDSLEDTRIVSALKRAQDRLETGFEFGATFGTMFRIAPWGSRGSYPVGGGTVTEAGMETPRSLQYEKLSSRNIASSGQASVRIVDLANPSGTAVSVLAYREDQAKALFSKGLTKPAYFQNRRELERNLSSKKQLIF